MFERVLNASLIRYKVKIRKFQSFHTLRKNCYLQKILLIRLNIDFKYVICQHIQPLENRKLLNIRPSVSETQVLVFLKQKRKELSRDTLVKIKDGLQIFCNIKIEIVIDMQCVIKKYSEVNQIPCVPRYLSKAIMKRSS